MCYKYPGPRCTAYAKTRYNKAMSQYFDDKTFDNYEAMENARKEYYMTPGGQKELKQRLSRERHAGTRQNLKDALEYGIESRKLALAALKAEDNGDLTVEHQEDSVPRSNPDMIQITLDEVSPKSLRDELNKGNSHQKFFVSPDGDGGLRVRLYGADDEEYRVDINENGKVLAFKDYDDDPEVLTEAQPCIQRSLDMQVSNQGEAPRHIAGQVKDVVRELQDPDKNWNTDVLAARFTYFGEASYDINQALRDGTLNEDFKNTLDTIMAEHTLKEDTVVYSGVRIGNNQELARAIKEGRFTNGGYMSTSLNKRIATNFSGGGNHPGAVLTMTLPAGTKCHDMRDSSEEEITLPRDFDLSTGKWDFLG